MDGWCDEFVHLLIKKIGCDGEIFGAKSGKGGNLVQGLPIFGFQKVQTQMKMKYKNQKQIFNSPVSTFATIYFTFSSSHHPDKMTK
jgi:hypothetical protein